MSVAQPMCDVCARRTSSFRCTAFPDGIPDAILLEGADHRQPIAGDRGRQFMAEGEPAYVAEVLRSY